MKHKQLLSFFVLSFLICCNLFGQKQKLFIQQKLDSLDNISSSLSKEVHLDGCIHIIRIKKQEQFDSINSRILEAFNTGKKNIKVRISPGVYVFKENHINLNNIQYPDVSITIEGNNSILTSDANYLHSLFRVSPWGQMVFAESNIEVIDKEKRLCRIPYGNNIDTHQFDNYTKVQMPQWFRAPVYKIIKFDDKGIYFEAEELDYLERFGRKGYSVNLDYLYSGNKPRFRLYDVSRERPCKASCFLQIKNTALRSFSLKNIAYHGNKSGSTLIVMNTFMCENIFVSKCRFDAIRDKVFTASKTDNVVFDQNTFTETAGNELSFTNGCKGVRVTGNLFDGCGIDINNTMCVRCNESEYYIADNTFRDFGYCAIAVGLWHGHIKKFPTKGIIEHNEIFYSHDYFAHKEQYTLMDGGAIYIWTQNDDAIIRYNYIHDYCGMRNNHGIYCDDGASNCMIYGNVVLNIPDGRCVTSRKVADQHTGFYNNANNFMANNMVDGSIVFEGYGDEERHVVKGANVVIEHESGMLLENKFDNIEIVEKDLTVSKSYNKILKKQIRKCLCHK